MKNYIYIIAIHPNSEDIYFRHQKVTANNKDEAYEIGQRWANNNNWLPIINGIANDLIVET